MTPSDSTLFGDISPEKPVVAASVTSPPRLRTAQRDQGEMFTESLDGRIEADHPVRTVWAFVEGLNLSPLLSQIKSVKGGQGRDSTDPRILLTLWLYASIEGVGSARQLVKLCNDHRVYQWICGKVSVNYHMLSDFRTGQGKAFEGLLAGLLASLTHEGLVDVNTVAQDGMRIRASAGAGSFRRQATLQEHLKDAEQHLQTLKKEIEMNPSQLESRRRKAQLRAAEEKKTRLEQALEHVQEIAQSREARKKGDAIRISIRPERFSFADVQKKDNVLDCTIENITFLGSVVRIQVQIGESKFNMDTFNNPFLELPKIGSKEQVTCSKEAVLVLDE